MASAEIHVGILPDRPIAEIAEIAALAEELGFAGVWIADSQSIFRDAYAALTLCAERTERIALASAVTNPVTRHPAVIADAFATLQEQSAGRALLGIGVGESAVHTLGLRPARLAELERTVGVIRSLLAREAASHDGHEIRMAWPVTPTPIWFASSGPRSLELGGRIADGVLFQVGAEPALVRYALERARRGAAEVGREPGREVRLFARLACSAADDPDWAREQVKGYAAAAAGTVFSSVPDEVMPADLSADIERMKRAYDYYEHTRSEARHKELLSDRVVDAVSVTGTPEQVAPRLRELVDLGVEGFVIPVTSSDPEASLRSLAAVIPEFA